MTAVLDDNNDIISGSDELSWRMRTTTISKRSYESDNNNY